ncbi:tetratricopeptide repeat protein 6-like [Hippocampus zosterae]|uniref:tetratricopeptide repeat protein 6-like n=1 Tax=Hippocampus zosterae TaxID=109293 RepID=UPI00223E8E9C|nr:tetratricopeptide repeat protein 6-like [Hippocampus zosterae]
MEREEKTDTKKKRSPAEPAKEKKSTKPAKRENGLKEVASRTKNASDSYAEGLSLKRRFEDSDRKDKTDINKAIDHLNNAITQLTTNTGQERQNQIQAVYMAARGDCYMLIKEYQKALYDFIMAIKFDPNESTYYQSRGNCQLQLGHINEALADFESAIKHKPNEGFNYLNRALVHARLKNFRAAIDDYTQALSMIKDSSGSYKAYLHRGNCLRYEKEFERAIEDLLKACELNKIDPEAQNSLGMAYFDNLQYDLALDRFSKAIELNDQMAKYYNNKGLAYYHLKEYSLSLEECNKALKLDPLDSRIYYNRGNSYLALNRIPESHSDFDRSIELDGQNPKFFHSKGLAYQDTDYERAIQFFEKALEVDPANVPSLYHLGLMQHRGGRLADAIDSLTKVLSTIGSDRLVLESRGLVYQDNKSHAKAIEDFTRAIELEPTYAEVYYYRGISKIEMARLREGFSYEEAVEDLKRAYRLLQDYEKALYYQNAALKQDRHNIEFLIHRSNIYVDIKYYAYLELHQQAIEPLGKAIALAPNQPCYYHERAKAYLRIAEHSMAVQDFFTVLRMQPRNANAYFGRAFAYKALRKYDEAAADFQKAKELDPFNPNLIINPKKIYEIPFIRLVNPGEEDNELQQNMIRL